MLQNLNEFRIHIWGTSEHFCWNDADYHFNTNRSTSGAHIERNLISYNEVFPDPCITIVITVHSAIVLHSSLYTDTVLTPDIRLSPPALYFETVSCFPAKINTLVFYNETHCFLLCYPVRFLKEHYFVACPITGEMLLFLFLFLLLMLLLLFLLLMMMMMGFLGAGTYFRIADFVGFKLTFVITDTT